MTSPYVRRLETRVTQTAARLVEHATREQLDVVDLPGARLPWYAIRNQADDGAEPATVFLFDEIGGSLGVQADQFVRDLEAIDAPVIHLRINSPGGSLFDAIAMHSALLHHPARVIAYVDSLAASAASVVAMAGDEIVMMPGSQMMIHDASAVHDGNAAEMAKMATFLDRQSGNIADLYRQKAGGQADEWRELMLAETWMFADEAVAFGLADRVEERQAPTVPDPELADAMARSFDLTGRYRYASRREAPAPARRQATATRATAKPRQEAMRMVRMSTDAERREAARVRVDAAGRQTGGRTLALRRGPAGLSTARLAAFPAQLRAALVTRNGQQRYHLTGHASVTDVLYEMWDEHGPYMEGIRTGAFDKTLAADPDVAFLVNHRGVTMARTTNGSLELGVDPVGFAIDAWLNPKRQDVSDLVVAVDDEDITEMSLAFMLDEDAGTWSRDFTEFWISEVDIHRGDVSAVNYGANPYTDVAARSRDVLADLDHLPAGAARAAVARLRARPDLDLDELFVEYDRARQVPVEHTLGIAPPASMKLAPAGRSISHIEALLLDD